MSLRINRKKSFEFNLTSADLTFVILLVIYSSSFVPIVNLVKTCDLLNLIASESVELKMEEKVILEDDIESSNLI